MRGNINLHQIVFLQLKLIFKLFILSVEFTEIQYSKPWEKKVCAFNLLKLIRYSIKLSIELRFCYVLMKIGIIPVFFIIEVFYSTWHLIKLGFQIFENLKLMDNIQQLEDYQNESMEAKDQIICNICLSEVAHGKKLPCGHVFHIRCIKYLTFT